MTCPGIQGRLPGFLLILLILGIRSCRARLEYAAAQYESCCPCDTGNAGSRKTPQQQKQRQQHQQHRRQRTAVLDQDGQTIISGLKSASARVFRSAATIEEAQHPVGSGPNQRPTAIIFQSLARVGVKGLGVRWDIHSLCCEFIERDARFERVSRINKETRVVVHCFDPLSMAQHACLQMSSLLVHLVHSLPTGGRREVVQHHVYHRVPELVVRVSGVHHEPRGNEGLKHHGRHTYEAPARVY